MSDVTIRRPVKWNSYSETNVGTVREMNEDSVMSDTDAGLWAVAEGWAVTKQGMWRAA